MKKTAILALSIFAGGCFHDAARQAEGESDAAPAPAAGEIVAVVNGMEIPEMRVDAYAPFSGGQSREAVLDNVIVSEIIAQAALAAEMHLRPDIAGQMQVAEQTVLGRAYAQEFLLQNTVTAEAVSLRYEELKSEFAGHSEYRTAHILVEDESLAQELHARIAADGGLFSELAREHSKDSGSAENDGDLGWADPRALVPEYAAEIERTEPGALAAAPVKTQFGWHIIRVDEKRPLSPPPLDDNLRADIEQAARAELFSAHLEELRAAADIDIK